MFEATVGEIMRSSSKNANPLNERLQQLNLHSCRKRIDAYNAIIAEFQSDGVSSAFDESVCDELIQLLEPDILFDITPCNILALTTLSCIFSGIWVDTQHLKTFPSHPIILSSGIFKSVGLLLMLSCVYRSWMQIVSRSFLTYGYRRHLQ